MNSFNKTLSLILFDILNIAISFFFMIWFIENYPESANIMKDNPDYQNRFK